MNRRRPRRRGIAPPPQRLDPSAVVVSVDVGGTFTDVVIQKGRRIVSAFKTRTTTTSPEVGILSALRESSDLEANQLVHSTTLATNALLTQDLSVSRRTGLVTTHGFGDIIEIGRQNRSELYNLRFARRPPLIPSDHRYGVERRQFRKGSVVPVLRQRDLDRTVSAMKQAGIESVAISFLHSYSHPKNERIVARRLRRDFRYISASSEISPEPREYERTSSTVVNAVLMPIISDYIGRLAAGLPRIPTAKLSMMSSAGGLVSFDEVSRRPVQIIESGPAAGVVAAAELAKALRVRNAISFDMGGTTAKAGTIRDGSMAVTTEFEVGGTSHHGRTTKGSGYPVRFPFIDLVEVSAGGGTIISTDTEGVLSVGPRSAGAEPGPACYGLGGVEPTLTDANLWLGTLGETMLGGAMQLDRSAANRALQSLGEPYEVAEGALRLADLEMARAIRLVTVERGLDPAEFALIAFGGAGPQHAMRIASELGIQRVVIPPRPGLFSSLGLLLSDWKFEARKAFPADIEGDFDELESGLTRHHRVVKFQRFAECRYSRQGSELTIPVRKPSRATIVRDFEHRHESTFGFRLPRPVEIVTIRVFAVAPRTKPTMGVSASSPPSAGRRRAVIAGRSSFIRTYARKGLALRSTVVGPCSVDDYDSSIFIPPGWSGQVGRLGELALEEART